jgi:sugar transferase (PEP-CTERM/EpsH1 system associated)
MTPLIVHVVYHFGTGGMENGMANLINHLPDGAYRHAVVCLSGYTEFRRRIRRPDVQFFDLAKRPGHDYTWVRRFAELLRRLKPAIVHTRNLNALEAQFVAAWLKVPGRVHGEHGRDVFDLAGRNWKYNLLRRAVRPFVHRYIAVSQDLADWLRQTVGVPRQRVAQIYNGVDSERFRPPSEAYPVSAPPGFFGGAQCTIGSVGRLVAVKDYPTLARAFIRLAGMLRDPSGLRLVIIGDGPHRVECQRLLDAAGLNSQVWLPGNRDDTAELLQMMDVFVLPSLGEGISNTILEAMATGIPVVASRVGGNPELVVEGQSGSLLEPGEPGRLAEILHAYVSDPQRRQREGRGGRQRVEDRFTLARMADAYRAVYDDLLDRTPA